MFFVKNRCPLLVFLCLIFCRAYSWELVYLTSFPRSGNHWTRFLIEEATHIATSSVYRDRDYPHLPQLFPWGGYATDHGYTGTCRYPIEPEPVVLKTHYPCLPQRPIKPITRVAICLIRHPIDALYSYHVYKQRKDDHQRIPPEILTSLIQRWREFYEFWEKQDKVLLIRYEDLYQDPSLYLTQAIEAIGYPATPEDIQRAVNRYPPQGTLLKHLRYYEKEDVELIRRELGDLLLKYGYGL